MHGHGVSGIHKRNRASTMPPTPPASSDKKRKRPDDTKGTKTKQTMSKADRAQQRIEGVPPSLTPVLLHAIKSRRKYLSKLGSSSSADTGTAAAPPPPPPPADPTDVLARVAARSEQEHHRRQAIQETDSPLERLRLASEDATTAFLNGVKREANSGGVGGRSDNGWSLDQGQGRAPARGGATADSVPVACLSFLLGLFSTDDGSVKLPTRRAALALASELLQRSAECREAFASAERLRQFLELVSSLGSSSRDTNHNGSSNNTNADNEGEGATEMSVQQEAVQLLVGLSYRFGTYYPRLSVAARFLEEREGIVLSSTTRGSGLGDIASNDAMADLRRGRDMAMAKIDKAHERVKRILDRADECFEILVPRFGGSGGGSSATGKEAPQKTSTNLVNTWLDEKFDDGDDDDLEHDDDIHWEEGDDNDDDGSTAPEDHEKAVERTLAQMERSRGIEDGGIEISLGGGDGAGSSRGASDVTTVAAREMLGRCVKLLEEKHLPRLVFWSDCLHKADNMTIQTGETSGTVQSSLVAMPPSVRKKRSETLNMVLSLKSDCSKTISSAAKLGIGGVPNDPSIQSSEGTTGKTTLPPATNAAAGVNNNPTGVGVASTSSLSAKTSWKLALGIKSKKTKKRKIRIKVASSSSRKSAVEIKSRKGL